MKVILATRSDEGLIKKIHKESNSELGSFNLFYSWDNFLKRKGTYKFYVVEGKAFMRYGYSPRMKCYTIKEIGVLKEFRGQGIADLFFNVAKSPLYLTCNIDNDAGNRFYKKMGMKLRGVKSSKNGKQQMNVWVK